MKDLFIVPDHLKLPKKQFNAIVEAQTKHIHASLASKGEEYNSGDDDALHNFNVAMAIEQAQTSQKKTREDTIWDMAKKHYVSIMDMRVDLLLGRPTHKITVAYLDEKFGDMINYLILMKASFMQTLKLPIPVGSSADTVRSEDVTSGEEIWIQHPNLPPNRRLKGFLFGGWVKGTVVYCDPDEVAMVQSSLTDLTLQGFILKSI